MGRTTAKWTDDYEAGPCLYWAFRFPCGLPVELTFHLGRNALTVNSDAPEIDHLIRHVRLPVAPAWTQPQTPPEIIARWRHYHGWLERDLRRPAEWDSEWELWR